MDQQLRTTLEVGDSDLLAGVANDSATATLAAALEVETLRDNTLGARRVSVTSLPGVPMTKWISRVILAEAIILRGLRRPMLVI